MRGGPLRLLWPDRLVLGTIVTDIKNLIVLLDQARLPRLFFHLRILHFVIVKMTRSVADRLVL